MLVFPRACVVHNKKFILDLDLYSAIVPEVSRAERGGCLFELAKEKKGEAWPRLLKSKAKVQNSTPKAI